MHGQSLSNPPHMTLVEPAPGWSGIGMGEDGKFRIDGSALKAGYKCSTQATLRYGWGLTAKAEKAALLAGTAFHEAPVSPDRVGGVAAVGPRQNESS